MANSRGPLNSADPTTSVLVGGVFNAVAPAPGDQQGCALQLDASGNLLVNAVGGSTGTVKIEDSNGLSLVSDGAGALKTSMTNGIVAVNSQTWLTGVAGTDATVVCTGYNTVIVTLNGSGTITTGQATYEFSDDGGLTWYAASGKRTDTFSLATTTTLANNSTSLQFNCAGYTNFRARNSVTITGAVGQMIVRVMASSASMLASIVVGQTSASNLAMTATPVASGTLTLQASQVSAVTNTTTTRTTTTSLGFYHDLDILISFTGTGSVTGVLQLFLEDSADGGTTWDDLVASNTFTFGAAASKQHFFISGRIVTTATQGAAPAIETLSAGTVRNGPWGDRIRVREVVSGVSGSPTGVTYTITAIGKT